VLTRRSNVSPKHKSCKVRGSSPTPGEAMSAKLAANNMRDDMPADEPFGERLQRSWQSAVFLLWHQRC